MEGNAMMPAEEKSDVLLKKAVEHETLLILKMCPAGQEPVLTILRAHLLAEHYLERAIAARLPRGDRVIEAGLLSFAQKLNVVEGLDLLPDRLVQSLRGLNRIRNSCSHEMEREITMPDIERIGRPFGSEFTSLRQQHYGDVKTLLHQVALCIGRDLSGSIFYLEKGVAEKFQANRVAAKDTK
jgi:hypothetical protein